MNQDNNADKNSMSIIWGIFGIFLLGGVIWYFLQDYIKYAFIKLKYSELWFLSLFFYDLDEYAESMQYITVEDIGIDEALYINDIIGGYLVYPAVLISAILIFFLYKGHASLRFNKAYDMKKLAKQEQANYPQIAPVVKEDLVAADISKGPWAMATNPMPFGKQHKLLKVEVVADTKAIWRAEGVHKATVIKDKTTRLFYHQMGSPWQGSTKLPPHTKALFAIFAARVEHDLKTATKFLEQLSASYAKGKLDYTGIDELLKKYINSKAVIRCTQKHAYVLTVMASMIELARMDGVCASADFLWLKPTDRPLWYMLNNVGRQTAFTEVAGPFAHWKAEKEMARPLNVPVVSTATAGFERAIAGIVYQPDEDEEKQE